VSVQCVFCGAPTWFSSGFVDEKELILCDPCCELRRNLRAIEVTAKGRLRHIFRYRYSLTDEPRAPTLTELEDLCREVERV
jgi:hypothetical protein